MWGAIWHAVALIGALATAAPAWAVPENTRDPGPVRVTSRTSTLELDRYMMVLEDPGAQLTIADVVQADGDFRPLASPRANLGRTESAIWVRLRFHNAEARSDGYFVLVEWPRLTEVDFYFSQPTGDFEHYRSGFRVPFEERAFPNPLHTARFTLKGFEDRTLFMRVRSDSELLFTTRLLAPDAFAVWGYRMAGSLGLLYGMLLALGLYNLLLFFQLRRSYYGLYIGALTSFGFLWWLNTGHLATWPALAHSGLRLEVALADLWMFFRLAFTRSFLHVRQVAPPTDRALAVLQWGVLPAWALFGLLLDPGTHDAWGTVLALVLVSATLVPGVQARRANVRMARWFVEATGLLATGLLISVLVFAGLPIDPRYMGGAILLATLIELFVLSLALSDRVRNLTEQREQALRHVQTERLASLQGLVGGVTHELNSPLGSLHSTADSLERVGKRLEGWNGHRPPDADRALAAIPQLIAVTQDATNRISTVVRALHNFSQVDASEHGKLDLKIGIDSALVLLQNSLNRISVDKHYGNLPPIECRPAEINQVFMALLKNAIEAMPDGGQLDVELGLRNGMAQVLISDTGVGIKPELLARIFEPRLSRSGDRVRMTLGLSTAKRIVDAHEGTITIDSDGGQPGTRVTVTLPLHAARERVAERV